MAGGAMRRGACVALALLLALLPSVPALASVRADDDGFDLIDFLLGGLKDLFIPDEDYLQDWQADISGRFDDKFGGITNALGYISGRFEQLRGYRDLGGIFAMEFPPGSFLHGIRGNLLTPARGVLAWVRVCMTGVAVLATALCCYHKVRRMVSK